MSSSQWAVGKYHLSVLPPWSSTSSSLPPTPVVLFLRDLVWMGALEWIKVGLSRQRTEHHRHSSGWCWLLYAITISTSTVYVLFMEYATPFWVILLSSRIVLGKPSGRVFVHSEFCGVDTCICHQPQDSSHRDFWRMLCPHGATRSSDRHDLWLSAYFQHRLCSSVFKPYVLYHWASSTFRKSIP